MQNTPNEQPQPRKILTFSPVIPEGRENDYNPPVRNMPIFKDDLVTMKNRFIALSQSMECVVRMGVKL